MTEKNKALRQFLYNTATVQCREWMKMDRNGDTAADYIKGFWIGLGFSILAAELAEEYPNAKTEDLAEFMTVEVSGRGAEIVGEVQRRAWALENADM